MPRLSRILSLTPRLLLGVAILEGCAPVSSPGRFAPEVDFRVYDTSLGEFIDLVALSQNVSTAHVVFFGEFHDDPVTHYVQRRLLAEIGMARGELALGLEMFDRDVQPVLDGLLRGEVSERDFLVEARPWPNYRTDYRPLVELAARRGWPVVGTNLPQDIARAIAREGIGALEGLTPAARAFVATEVECPRDEYWDRFVAVLSEGSATGHGDHSAPDAFWNLFEAQCARDETMAETITELLRDNELVFHVNGAFHTDFQMGIVPRLLRRRPQSRVAVISALPVDDPDAPPLIGQEARADYVIFTRRLPPTSAPRS